MDEEGVKDKNPKSLFTEQMREEERMFEHAKMGPK
jgi:hypothetical protein